MTDISAAPASGVAALDAVRGPIDEALAAALGASRADLADLDPQAATLVDELERLVLAGGSRLRPALCIWGFRAALDADEPLPGLDASATIVQAAAALELLHTMALIHDDVMDESPTRRGVASTATHLAGVAVERRYPVPPDRFGRSAAILAGDLAFVLADRTLLGSGFDDAALVRALAPYHQMRVRMAAGQFLDLAGLAVAPDGTRADAPDRARAAARLKGGSYTVEGPLEVGAGLAGATDGVHAALRAFAAPLGEAFQLRDDLVDGDRASGVTPGDVNALVDRARAALRDAPIHPASAAALDELARTVTMR